MKSLMFLVYPIAGLLLSLSCNPCDRDDTNPAARGLPGQIIAIPNSSASTPDTIIWDAGRRSERIVSRPQYPTGQSPVNDIGTSVGSISFQIPHEACTGYHHVLMRKDNKTDTTVTVLALKPPDHWPAPRIEDIAIRSLTMNTDGTATIELAISVANVDVDALVRVNDQTLTSTFSSALTNPYFLDHTPDTYSYPVFHYGLLIGSLPPQNLGQCLHVEVTNANGLKDSRSYQLPTTLDSLDSDNDGLLDVWETSIYHNSYGTIDLHSMRCTLLRKDILVEADWIADATPDPAIWGYIEGVFANAPILNPDGSQGIVIHIDRGQDKKGNGPFREGGDTLLPSHDNMDFGEDTTSGYMDFFAYKKPPFFKKVRLEVFHYCVFGRTITGGFSGHGEIFGNDFIVAFSQDPHWHSVVAQVGTFIHELGHNLGLRHGGLDNGASDQDELYKPNQRSSMNYRYQFDGFSPDCSLRTGGIQSYSQGMLTPIDESRVDEKLGVCDGIAIDFNGDHILSPRFLESRPPMNVNFSKEDDWDATDTLYDYDEWGNLKLNFRLGRGWNAN